MAPKWENMRPLLSIARTEVDKLDETPAGRATTDQVGAAWREFLARHGVDVADEAKQLHAVAVGMLAVYEGVRDADARRLMPHPVLHIMERLIGNQFVTFVRLLPEGVTAPEATDG